MTSGFFLILGTLCSLILVCQCISEKNWDLLYYLKTDRNIHMTYDITLKLTSSTNFSQLFLSPKQFFPDNNVPDRFVIFAKLKIKNKIKKSITLLTISDPDYKTRLKLSFKAIPGFVDKIELSVIYNPVSFHDKETRKDFILPFTTISIWKIALLFTADKIILYTGCWDKIQPVEYQSVDLPLNTGRILFKNGAILQLFSDKNHGQKLKGEIYELSFANYAKKVNDLCHNVDGSGDKKFQINHGMDGNLLLKTVQMDEDSTTMATSERSRSNKLTTTYQSTNTLISSNKRIPESTYKPDLKQFISKPQITEITTPTTTANFESHFKNDFYTSSLYRKKTILGENQFASNPSTPDSSKITTLSEVKKSDSLENPYKMPTENPKIKSFETTKFVFHGNQNPILQYKQSQLLKLSSTENTKSDVTTPAELDSDYQDFMDDVNAKLPVTTGSSDLSTSKLSKRVTEITPSVNSYENETVTVGSDSKSTDEEYKISSNVHNDKGTTTDGLPVTKIVKTRTTTKDKISNGITRIRNSKSLFFVEDSKSDLMDKTSDSSIEKSLENLKATDSLTTDTAVPLHDIKIEDELLIINQTERFINDNTTVTGYKMYSSEPSSTTNTGNTFDSTTKNINKSPKTIDSTTKPEEIVNYSTQLSIEYETFTKDSTKKKEVVTEDKLKTTLSPKPEGGTSRSFDLKWQFTTTKCESNENSSTSSVSQNISKFGSKSEQENKVTDKGDSGCKSIEMDGGRSPAGRNVIISSQIDEDEKRDCKILSKLRLMIPQTGPKGETGLKGDQGEKGIQGLSGLDGVCKAKDCEISEVVKGPKGDPGSCKTSECVAQKGDKGLNGQKGDSGIKGAKGDSSSMDGEMIRSIVSSVVKAEVEYLGVKGEKGNEGNCKCNPKLHKLPASSNRYDETYNVGYGSLVFENKETLEQVSSKLPPGSMAYILKSDIFVVKIDETNNIWRVISLDSKSKDWILPHPIKTAPVEMTRVPYTNKVVKKLHLIALSLPTMGDLKQMIRQPGGYSGAIFQCQQAGDVYGFGRSLYPLLNTETFSLKYTIKETYRNMPIFNTRGEILANDFTTLLSENESLQNDILDFKKNPISTNIISPCVWIGKEQGIHDNEYDKNSESKCLNWMSRDPLAKGLVYLVNPQKSLFDENNKQLRSCSQQCYILCIQTEPHE